MYVHICIRFFPSRTIGCGGRRLFVVGLRLLLHSTNHLESWNYANLCSTRTHIHTELCAVPIVIIRTRCAYVSLCVCGSRIHKHYNDIFSPHKTTHVVKHIPITRARLHTFSMQNNNKPTSVCRVCVCVCAWSKQAGWSRDALAFNYMQAHKV